MKRNRLASQLVRVVITILMFLSNPGVIQAQTVSTTEPPENIQTSVMSVANQWIKAWNELDLSLMKSLHAHDLVYYWRGRPRGYQTFINELQKHVFPHATFSVMISEPRVQSLAPDVGIVSFQMRDPKMPNENPGAAVTLVIAHRENEWKIVHIHESPVR